MFGKVVVTALAIGVSACGGKADNPPETGLAEIGPVHEGLGVYELTITAVDDDCTPAFPVGELGQVLLLVKTSGERVGMNLPFCSTSNTNCQRSDMTYGATLVATMPVNAVCAATQRLEATVTTCNSEDVMMDVTTSFSGLSGCPANPAYPSGDCTSHRRYQFHWVRSCPGNLIAMAQTDC
jgi:hypothetical protein